MQAREKTRRTLVWTLVAIGHLVLVFLLSRVDRRIIAEPARSRRPVELVLLTLPTPTRVTATSRVAVSADPAPVRLHPRSPPSAASSPGTNPPPAPPSAPVAATDDPAAPDWFGEAAQVAESQSTQWIELHRRRCDEAARQGSIPPDCVKYKTPNPWKPQPKTFGIDGGLPYVRLGRRCVVGLGFFGCAIGKLPEANGHVLDDMRDPNRPTSSVPPSDQ